MPGHTADQLCQWIYQKGVIDPDGMTNISSRNRQRLPELLQLGEARIHRNQDSNDGTRKLLLEWPPRRSGAGSLELLHDVQQTECVMIPSGQRRTACVSSQVGCPVGCRFCASGLEGLDGNLTTARIVEQVWRLQQLPGLDRITNIVFMGMGEPLANYAAVTSAIRTINADWAFNISARRITVSTVGLPTAIRKLVDFEIPVTLALSLHAPNDQLRREIIPWAEYATIEELLDACDEYFRKTGREVTLEYILLGGVNDQPEHARELANLAGRLRSNINLIRYNEVESLPYRRPESADVHQFQSILLKGGVNTHIRASRGRDIAAACGQLRQEASTED